MHMLQRRNIRRFQKPCPTSRFFSSKTTILRICNAYLESETKQNTPDAKQFQLSWRHDAIDKSALEKGFAAFGGVVPNFATKILDRDQLAQYLGGAGVDAAFQSIVKQATQRGQLAETIVGTAGAGKTTLAIQKAGGKNFVTNAKDLSPDDQLIVVRAAKTVVDSPEFTQAGKITYLKGAKDVINQMRDQRSKQIREGTSETGFGRDPSMKFGSTSGVLTEALLAESYAGKLSVYERQADMSLKKANGNAARPGRAHPPGVCHRIVVEDYALPGDIIALTDSHSPTAGVMNAFAFGVGSTAMAFALRTGLMPVTVPKVVRVEVIGDAIPVVIRVGTSVSILMEVFILFL